MESSVKHSRDAYSTEPASLINILANTIAPAYDISNSYPKYISWFRGVLITVAVSLAVAHLYSCAGGSERSFCVTYT